MQFQPNGALLCSAGQQRSPCGEPAHSGPCYAPRSSPPRLGSNLGLGREFGLLARALFLPRLGLEMAHLLAAVGLHPTAVRVPRLNKNRAAAAPPENPSSFLSPPPPALLLSRTSSSMTAPPWRPEGSGGTTGAPLASARAWLSRTRHRRAAPWSAPLACARAQRGGAPANPRLPFPPAVKTTDSGGDGVPKKEPHPLLCSCPCTVETAPWRRLEPEARSVLLHAS